jgi:hypothetical protein
MNSTGSYNIAIGYHAQYNNTTGNYNTALGNRSLLNNIAGFNNTAIGDSALIENNYGDNNTAVGHGAGPGSSYGNLGNTTCLGYNTTVSTSNDVCIGNTSVNWIGGQVTWSTYSDERMKEDISKDVIGLDFIMKLNPVTYHVNKDKIDNILGVEDNSDYPEKYDIEKIKQSGFLAQEVEQAAVESGYDFSGVSTPINEHTPYSLSYAQFVVPLVKAVQEQQEIIEELRQEIKELKKSAE